MTATALSLTQSQTLQALGQFLQTVLDSGVEIVVGQDNRVPAPQAADYVVMTPVTRTRLATNVTTFSDGFPNSATTRADMQETLVDVQLDVHGPASADNAQVITTLFRSGLAVDEFKTSGLDVTPLYTSQARQVPFRNEAQQIESRWVVDAVLQCNPVVTTSQDFADSLGLGLISVDVTYGNLRVTGTNIVAPNGGLAPMRGYSWGRWGTAIQQDAVDNTAAGATCVRIPLRWWGLYGDAGVDSRSDAALSTARVEAGHLATLDANIRWAFQSGLKIILFVDSNCGQNGMQDGFGGSMSLYCDPDQVYPNGRNFWSDPTQRALFFAVWRLVAKRYAPYVAIFEPLPEPAPTGYSDEDIIIFYDQLMAAIRAVAPGVPFLVGPRSYKASDAKKVYNAAWKDVIYTINLFFHANGTPDPITDFQQRLAFLTSFRDTKNVAIFVQQVGVQSSDDPNNTYLPQVLAILNAAGVGWTYWELRGSQNAGGYEPIYQDGNGGWITKTAVLNTINAAIAA